MTAVIKPAVIESIKGRPGVTQISFSI